MSGFLRVPAEGMAISWQRFPNLNFSKCLQNGCNSSPDLAIGLGIMCCMCSPASSSLELDLGLNHHLPSTDQHGTGRTGLWAGSQYGDGVRLE